MLATIGSALGLGFFSIGVGLTLMVTYAAYADRAINLRHAAIITVVGDTLISFLAGFAVFPVVFAHGLDPASGPGLVFVTMPVELAAMPFGGAMTVAFFLLLTVAALASAISLLEMPVAYLHRRFAWPRALAAAVAAGGCWIAGRATALSFNRWADWHPLAAIEDFATATVFDLLDHLTSNVMLPLGGFAIALFAGWVMPATVLTEELHLGLGPARALVILLRYVAPRGIAAATLAPLLI